MKKLGFIGAGNMANALLSGIISSKLFNSENLFVSDPDENKLNNIQKQYGVNVYTNNEEVLKRADIIILAIKPQIAKIVLSEFNIDSSKLIISIMAGVSIKTLKKLLSPSSKIVRVMPNTPALIHKGISAMCFDSNVSIEEAQLAGKILSSVGSVVEVEEKYMDAVCAISGSGPAYFYMIIEAMSDAGVELGLPRSLATKLAAATAAGSAGMILDTNLAISTLKNNVSSPAGTTIAAIHVLEKLGLRGTLMDAVCSAAKRSAELDESI